MIQIKEVVIHRLTMPLQIRFETSFGVQTDRDLILIELLASDGTIGWGECVAAYRPYYNEETTDSAQAVLCNELIPLVFSRNFEHPSEFFPASAQVRGNRMAKFSIEGALWDIYAQQNKLSLSAAIGGKKLAVDVGVSIGIMPIEELLSEVENYKSQGYRRIKIKIKPGWDIEPVRIIREHFPNMPLMGDANCSYEKEDFETLRKLDKYELMMIEQPLAEHAWVDCAALQAQLNTPICLDESIHSLEDFDLAMHLKACRIVNVKLGRIGGIQAALELTKKARSANIALWSGGMLETGIGRAFNVALATLDGFTLPGDTAGSSRYWKPDIIDPEVVVENGQVKVPSTPGLGYAANRSKIELYQTIQKHFRKGKSDD